MAKTIKLSQKITVAGKEISEIELREITTRDIRALGMPIKVKADGTADIDMNVCGKYIARLSNLTDGDVDGLPVADFTNAAFVIITFFNPATPNMPNNASQD